ncbi:MAG: 2-phospho-L-lactate guanylyltransferase [Ilumatobacteraceae bacterium]
MNTRAVDAVLLVPVKAFGEAKARLAPILDPPTRDRLARWTASRVLAAAGRLPTYVACDNEEVAEWATAHGATVLWHPGTGLNGAVNASIAALRDSGVEHVVVAHGDLPRATDLAAVVRYGMLTLVPDRRGDGTNVAAMPTAMRFELDYGPGSFRRHLAAAFAAGIGVEVRRDPLLGIDIDTPQDLCHPMVLEVLPTWLPTILVNQLLPSAAC